MKNEFSRAAIHFIKGLVAYRKQSMWLTFVTVSDILGLVESESEIQF